MKLLRDAVFGLLCIGLIAGCASPVPPLGPDQTAIIPGSATADQNPADATRTVLVNAARVTVDHGFQYFQIVPQPSGAILPSSRIQPGVDVKIRVYQKEDIPIGVQGLWDANKLLEEGVPDSVLATGAPPPSALPPSSAAARNPPPRCTAYGCVW